MRYQALPYGQGVERGDRVLRGCGYSTNVPILPRYSTRIVLTLIELTTSIQSLLSPWGGTEALSTRARLRAHRVCSSRRVQQQLGPTLRRSMQCSKVVLTRN
jgi:hypothetical protein